MGAGGHQRRTNTIRGCVWHVQEVAVRVDLPRILMDPNPIFNLTLEWNERPRIVSSRSVRSLQME